MISGLHSLLNLTTSMRASSKGTTTDGGFREVGNPTVEECTSLSQDGRLLQQIPEM